MIMLEQSQSTLPDTTIINCFKIAGISIQSQLSSTQDTDDLFAKLAEVQMATFIQSLPSDEETAGPVHY